MTTDTKDLKVAHLWRRPDPSGGGGGGVSMDVLHRSLSDRGVESLLFCIDNPWGRSDIRVVPQWPRTEKWLGRITSRLGLNDIHRVSSWLLRSDEDFQQADVVHIHGLHSGFLSYLALPHLTRNKPTVFTLHDHWAITGHCAHPLDCERWQIGCGRCPYLDTHPSVRRDATRVEWRLKRASYRHSEIVFVAQNEAQWAQAENSIIASHPMVLIPPSVDTSAFRPVDRSLARRRIGVASDRMVVMFAATKVTKPHKGGHFLRAALEALPSDLQAKVSVLVLGRDSESFVAQCTVPGVALPFTTDQEQINLAYNAADVFAFPSTNETFGQVWAEALASGTPVASFSVGGAPDHLRPDKTGIVVPIGDVGGLADGIQQILTASPSDRSRMRKTSREYAVSELSTAVGAERYLALYRSLL